MVEKQIKKWTVDLFMDDDEELMKEVTSVAAHNNGVTENKPQFFCAHSHASCCCWKIPQKERRCLATFQLSCYVMDEDISNYVY